MQRVAGATLEGLEAAGDELETRLTTERARLQRLLAHALATVSAAQMAERRLPEAEAAASRRLALDPFDEEALRDLMSALAHQGRRNAALDAYQQAAERLRRELAVAPQQETTALWQEIRQDRTQRAKADAAPPAPLPAPADPPVDAAPAAPDTRHMRHVAVLHLVVPAVRAALMDPDPEAAEAAARPILERISAAATRAGGACLGGAGPELAFEFGAVAAQESPALTAALLAFDLRDLGAACGVHAGDGLAGARTGPGPGRAGSRANSPSPPRPGRFGSGPRPGPSAAARSDLAEAGAVDLPGTAVRLPSWSVRGNGARACWAARRARGLSRFIGRDDELAELERNAERGRTGGRVFVVVGEAGLGKSRLVHEFLSRHGDSTVNRVENAQFGRGTGLSGLRLQIRNWLGLAPERPARDTLAAAEAELGTAPQSASLLQGIAVLLDLMDLAGDWMQLSP